MELQLALDLVNIPEAKELVKEVEEYINIPDNPIRFDSQSMNSLTASAEIPKNLSDL